MKSVSRVLYVAVALSLIAISAACAQATVTLPAMPSSGPNVIGGLVIDGKPLMESIAPYIQLTIAGLLALFVKIIYGIAQKWAKEHGINIDDSYRAGLTTSVQNVAAGLVAQGIVKVEQNGKITVPDNVLTQAAKDVIETRAPDAVAHFQLSPDDVAKRIVEQVAQVAPVTANVTPPAQV